MASPALNFAFVCAIVVMRTSTANSKHHEQLQTISEGSDCKCRCVMRMEDGGPCPYNPNTRRTLYYVDTVSGGSDCRCSCLSPAPPKDCEPENPSGAGTSQGNTEGREPVISIPISDDGQGNRVSVTISGTSDASRALDRAAQAGNLEEILSRAVTGMNVIKMHSSVTKMVLAMLDLEQILSTNFTEETQILRRNMGKVAKRLEKSEEYGEVRQLVEEEIQRMDGSPNEQNNETLSNQTETTMASVETVDSTNYPLLISSNYVTPYVTETEVATADSMTTGLTETEERLDTEKIVIPELTNVGERFSVENDVMNLNHSEFSNSTMKHVLSVYNTSRNQSAIFANGTYTLQTLARQSWNRTSSRIIHLIFIAGRNVSTSGKNRFEEAVLNTSAVAVSSLQSNLMNATEPTSVQTVPTFDEPRQATTEVTQPLMRTAGLATESGSTTAFPTKTTRLSQSVSGSTSTAREQSTTPITSTQTPVETTTSKIVKTSIAFEPYRRQEEVDVVEDSTKLDYYDDSYYEDEETTGPRETLVGGRTINEQNEFDISPDISSPTTSSNSPSTASRPLPTTSSPITSNPAAKTSIVPPGDYDGVQENYFSNSEEEDDEYDDDDYYSYDLTTTTPKTTTTAPTTTSTTTVTTTTEQTSVSTTLAPCGTLYNLSQPRTVHNFGRKEGSWMKDLALPPSKKSKIYVTNFYYGNNLIEFESLYKFKHFRWSNSYILPYNWIGTGHIVYNGSFYFNRAFSKNLIKYNLKYRFVSAWGHLRYARYDSTTPFTWRGHSKVQMAADESGLWVIYPAYNDFDELPNTQTFVINKVNPTDLQTMRTWKTTIRRRTISHVFMMCGVVYTTDRYNTKRARITHAYDTHTGVRRALHVPYINKFSYNVQLLYHPKERRIYSWDNGHQVIYDVNMSI